VPPELHLELPNELLQDEYVQTVLGAQVRYVSRELREDAGSIIIV
jgi:hypothetical protein